MGKLIVRLGAIGGLTVTDAVAFLVVSATDVAVTVTARLALFGTDDGAVYTALPVPAAAKLPQLAVPHVAEYVTARGFPWLSDAANVKLWPAITVTVT